MADMQQVSGHGSFALSITLGNDDMQDCADVARALPRVIAALENGAIWGTVIDVNGNTVGEWSVS